MAGSVTVDGPGSTWTNTNLFAVGAKGTGQLDITNSGTVISRSLVLVGQTVDGDGSVIVDGLIST